jgi:hypothetical protein
MSENDNLEEIWNMIQKEYPLVMFTGSSRLYTTVRRMQAEKKFTSHRVAQRFCHICKVRKTR